MTDSMNLPRNARILGVSPCTRGCGFAVLEGGEGLLTWGVAELYSADGAELLVRIDALVERYRPTVLCLESSTKTNRREPARIRLALVSRWAHERRLPVFAITRAGARNVFGLPQTATNHDTAAAVASAFPELEVYLPKKRRLWESERKVLRMFEAVAFAAATIGSSVEQCSSSAPRRAWDSDHPGL
jgi:hypothetical protein